MVDTEEGIYGGQCSKKKRLCRQDSDGGESESALRALPLGRRRRRGGGASLWALERAIFRR